LITIACHTGGLAHLSLEDALGTVARLGFRYVDLAHADLERAAVQPTAEAAVIHALLTDFNLTLTDLVWALPAVNAPDPVTREAELVRFERLLPFAKGLGTPGITLSPGSVQDDGAEHSMARAVVALLRMKRAAENVGLRLSIEPQVDSVAELPADALMLLDCVPGLRLTLDYAQLIYQGLGRKDIAPLIGKAAHIQIRQAAKNRLQTSFEIGKLDMREVIEDLNSAGYHGGLSVEYLSISREYGAVAVDVIEETVKTRDALRNARRAVLHL